MWTIYKVFIESVTVLVLFYVLFVLALRHVESQLPVVAAQLLSCVPLLQTHGLSPARLLCPWDFSGKNTGVGCHFLLQGIFPTQGSNFRHEDKFTMLFIQQIK